MDQEKRQALQKALEAAIEKRARIAVRLHGQDVGILPDFTCFETHVEATSVDGQMLTLPYEDIERVTTS